MYLLCKPAWFSTSTISAPITTVTTSSSSSTIVTPSISSGTFSMLNHNSEMEKNKGMSKFSHICSLLTQSQVLNYRYQIFEAFTNNSISFKMTDFFFNRRDIEENGENTFYKHFSPFSIMFPKV